MTADQIRAVMILAEARKMTSDQVLAMASAVAGRKITELPQLDYEEGYELLNAVDLYKEGGK